MDKALTLETDNPDAAELRAAIAHCLARIDELREDMHRADSAIEESQRQTLANLVDINAVLAELKAA